jgi:hypothetical protein
LILVLGLEMPEGMRAYGDVRARVGVLDAMAGVTGMVWRARRVAKLY